MITWIVEKIYHYSTNLTSWSWTWLYGARKENKIDWGTKWLSKNKNVKLIFGDETKGHDGNLYNPDIINHYCNYYKNKKADLVTSDGGFLLKGQQENHKGQYHNQLF